MRKKDLSEGFRYIKTELPRHKFMKQVLGRLENEVGYYLEMIIPRINTKYTSVMLLKNSARGVKIRGISIPDTFDRIDLVLRSILSRYIARIEPNK